MKFKTDPEALILGALAEGPLHGYAIVKTIKESSQGVFKLSEGQLYPLLHRMLAKGWVSAEWETPVNGPARKTYLLLESGRKELEERKRDWKLFADAVGGLLITEGGNA